MSTTVPASSSFDPFAACHEHAAALAAGRTTSLALVEGYLDRIARLDGHLHAYVLVMADSARAEARASDLRRAAGATLGPLDGVPIAVKDLCAIAGTVTTAGSLAWAERASEGTATVVARLRAAGMPILGKTHMVEFAFGGWGTNPRMGTPRNPWDAKTHRVPGGSSSGSGVAVAAGLAPAAIGSDTGGSVRIPASLNGVTGLKTTFGLVSLAGAVSLSTTLDSIGPLTRDCIDAALVTAAIAGPDEHDPGTEGRPRVDFAAALAAETDLAGMRIAVLPEARFPLAVEPAVRDAFRAAQATLRDRGARVVERDFPFDLGDLMRRNGQIIAAEAWAQHRGYAEDASLPLGGPVRGRVVSGKAITGADYIDAIAHHRATCRAWTAWMRETDAMLTPTLPRSAAKLEEVDESATPLAAFTRAGNYIGASGLSLPAGFDAARLPVGVQLLGKPFDDALLLRIGAAFQRATTFHRRTPRLGD